MGLFFSLFKSTFGSAFTLLKRVLLVVIVLSTVVSLFVHFMIKDRPQISIRDQYEKQQAYIYAPLHDERFQETDERKILLLLYRNISCGLFGETCTDDPAESYKFKDGSLFGMVSNGLAMPYSVPPASALGWAHEGLSGAGLIPQAYAAEGIGFSSIKGFLYVWSAFRNVALLLLVLITIILGFLIMFRANLDGQTAISIQSILPRIVLTMLYVSFSFAIAGFFIDLMYLLIGLSVELIWGGGLGMDVESVTRMRDEFFGAGMNNLLWININPFIVGSAFWDMIPMSLKGLLDMVIFTNLNALFTNTWLRLVHTPVDAVTGIGLEAGAFGFGVGGNIGKLPRLLFWLLEGAISGWLTWILPGIILGAAIALTIVFFAFRIFFMLLSSYIKIMLYIIFAPIIIVFEIIPGRGSFAWWLKNLAGELIAFPTVVIIMVAGQMINKINDATGPFLWSLGSQGTNTPPNTFTLPFLYGFRPEDFNVIVALGIILITPDFVKMVKGWVGVQDSGLKFGVGTFFTGATAILGGGLGMATQAGGLTTALPGFKRYVKKIPGLKGMADSLFTDTSNKDT